MNSSPHEMAMEGCEEKDTYVSQLKDVFDSCDTTGSGCLDKVELQVLCEKLHLLEHAETLEDHLLGNQSEVSFEDFKECFVAVLMQAIPNEDIPDESKEEDMADREVSPKFTLGRKKYGRRSRPASIVDDDNSASSPVLSPQNSVDQPSSCDPDSRGSMNDIYRMQRKIAKLKTSKPESLQGKRRLSPVTTQQPPVKSGRMSDDKQDISQEACSSLQQTSDSDTDMTLSFESNPVQYLQDTWKKLNIGQSGYLNVEELALVCEHIGMDMTEEVVAQLFEKLDCDQDGQISFDEFLQGLFQHGDPQSCDSPIRKIETSKSLYNDGSRDDHQITNTNISGIFSCIDPNNMGYADISTILELWESLEVPCTPQLLEELGFNTSTKINLADLSSVLEEVLCNALNRPILQLAFITFQNELQYLRQTVDQVQSERNKLRFNVEEANTRAALLAQEVDDNHAKLENSLQKKLLLVEKKYQEQAKVLVEELQQERESLSAQCNKLKQQFQNDISAMREEETKLKCRLNSLEQENNRLEQDLQEQSEKCIETEKLNEALQKELSIMPGLQERLADLESHMSIMQEQNPQNLLQTLQTYKDTNQELQDKIDELTLEIENMHQYSTAEHTSQNEINRTHSWLSDYKKETQLSGLKRRGSESSSEENSDDENPTIGKLRRTIFSSGNQGLITDIPPNSTDLKRTSKTSIDVLLTKMMMNEAVLTKKLLLAEEKCFKTEKALRESHQKYTMLMGTLQMYASSEPTLNHESPESCMSEPELNHVSSETCMSEPMLNHVSSEPCMSEPMLA